MSFISLLDKKQEAGTELIMGNSSISSKMCIYPLAKTYSLLSPLSFSSVG